MNNLKFIVTGTGRCGTVYAAKLLTELGIPCGHESIFNENGINKEPKLSYCSTHSILENKKLESWVDTNQIIADSSYLAVPFLQNSEIKNIPIIHIIRNPLKVISSFVQSLNYFNNESPGNDPWQNVIYNTLPELSGISTQIEKACYFYVNWNKKIEECKKDRDYIQIKIEKINSSAKFFEFIKKSPKQTTIDKNTNQFKLRYGDFTFNDIPNGKTKKEFIEICKTYKYNIKYN